MESFHLAKGDSEDIGFSTSCLISGVITFSEFKDWLYYVIGKIEDAPSYLYDIIDIKYQSEYVVGAARIVGFYPDWDANVDELSALDGIGYKRFPGFQSDAVSREEAIEYLEKNVHIERKFRNTFPFIDL